MYDLKDLLQRSIEENASDVHFTVGRPPCYRIDGVLSAIEGERLMPDTLEELLLPIMEERHREELKRDGQTDFEMCIRDRSLIPISSNPILECVLNPLTR